MKTKIFSALKQEYSSLGLADDIIQGHADSLAATGLITDENLDTIVKGQKPFLSALQSGIDKRVTAAVEKAKEKPAPGGEQVKVEPVTTGEPEWFIKYKADQEEKLKNLTFQNETFLNDRKSTERNNLISTKAKELGIPEWRQREGFVITDTMDDVAITSYLTGIKKNITTAGLESGEQGFALSNTTESAKEDAKVWAANLPDNN